MTSQQALDIVALSKGGNPKAIATLINRQLKAKGIEAKANLKGSCLEILLEAAQAPDKHSTVKFIGYGLTKLSPNGISTVRLFGKETGEDFFSWENSFSLPYRLEDKNLLSPSKMISDKANKVTFDKLETTKDFSYGVSGRNGQIKLTRKRAIISRKGFWGFVSQGTSGSKEIPISRITAIQFKKAGEITAGFLQFSIVGGIESTGGVFNAANDENTVLFETYQQKEFEEVKRYVDSVIDGEEIDFLQLNLPDFETAEKNRIEAQQRVKAKYDEQMRFSTNLTNLNGDFWLSVMGGFISFCAVATMLDNESLSLGGLLTFILGTLMIPQIWKTTEKQLGFCFSKKNRIISAIFILIVLFLLT